MQPSDSSAEIASSRKAHVIRLSLHLSRRDVFREIHRLFNPSAGRKVRDDEERSVKHRADGLGRL